MSDISSVLVVAGEASGDTLAARLLHEIRLLVPNLTAWGLGAARLREVGLEVLVDASTLNVSGFLEVVRHYPALRRTFDRILTRTKQSPPDVAILVDYPGFNLRLARALHKLGIPVVYYVAPQVWAWKEGRVTLLQRFVDDLIVAFPFEVEYFRRRGVKAHYFGNPHAEEHPDDAEPSQRVVTKPEGAQKPVIAYLPGSRPHEIDRHLPLMMRTAALLGSDYRHVVVRAATIDAALIDERIRGSGMEVATGARDTLRRAVAAVVKAGTSTLDSMLAGVPFVAVYATSTISYIISRLLIRVRFIAMPNILAGRSVVREYIQRRFQPDDVARHVREIIENPDVRRAIVDELASISQTLRGKNGVAKAAALIVEKYLAYPLPKGSSD